MRALLGLSSLALILACSGGKEDGGGGIFGDDTGDDGGGGIIPRDEDDDGYRDNVDCDDGDPSVNPGATETPYDGVDNDCDPGTPDDDLDGDGYAQALDCDDTNGAVNPGATEVAGDGLDNDCDASTCLNPGFASAATSWALPGGYGTDHLTGMSNSGYCSSGYDIPSYTTMDLTGDGLADLVVTYHCGDGSLGDTTWAVHENTGGRFAAAATSWALPGGYGADHFTQTANSGYCSSGYDIPSYTTMDLTGDGLPDLVVTYHCGDGSLGDTTWAVHENTGTRFAANPISWSLPSGYGSDHLT
ncbi:MAG: putative metal-binding motif-containing protein, partial [Alphaproteobacteria bacterium]|nr:putative metal-binding motif-containing protein [Alphaproteobacteria bacterium]